LDLKSLYPQKANFDAKVLKAMHNVLKITKFDSPKFDSFGTGSIIFIDGVDE